jgi:2-polyprenyl-6-methoxyphenol hydroxylase-like FAD-dependent oxidoreductase
MQAQVAIDNATGDITDIVTVLRGAGFAALSPSADSSASLLHYCVNHAADEIERLRDERRWIPVSERLPEDETVVLAWSGKRVAFGYMSDGQWIDTLYGWVIPLGPSHWMPLPAEPPAN